MTQLNKLSPQDVAARLQRGEIRLVDIRNPDERAREHIEGSLAAPIGSLSSAGLKIDAGDAVVFHCKSGMRTDQNCELLAASVAGDAFILEGGIDGWKRAGLPTLANRSAPLELNRQVQMVAGLLILLGVTFGALVHPAYYGLSAFVGAGLFFAGASGWCGMAHVLKAMPWNRNAGSA